MKKFVSIVLIGILFASCITTTTTTTTKEIRKLESFDAVNLVGNFDLYLIKNGEKSMEVIAKSTDDINSLKTEVRNGILSIYSQKECNFCKTPRYTIYLNHSEFSNLDFRGNVTLKSENVIVTRDLIVRGNGVLNGSLNVAVTNLNIDLNGVSNFNVSGNAYISKLNINGIGMIRANNLKTKNDKNISTGISFINQ